MLSSPLVCGSQLTLKICECNFIASNAAENLLADDRSEHLEMLRGQMHCIEGGQLGINFLKGSEVTILRGSWQIHNHLMPNFLRLPRTKIIKIGLFLTELLKIKRVAFFASQCRLLFSLNDNCKDNC
jgi:hypothetical protein